jgi:DNA repair protein RadC
MQKEITQIAEISVSYRPAKCSRPTILSSKDAYVIFQEFFPVDTIALQETFMVMYLNKANKVLGVYPASTGGITGTVADPRLILAVALKTVATSIILAHNHPSGNLKPSQQDIDLTQKIKEAGKWMDIKVLDHLIISPDDGGFYSLADEGFV